MSWSVFYRHAFDDFDTEKLTWYRDDGYILIGHHSRGAALLHIEVSRLEKSPTGTQREVERESLSHCSQILSVNIAISGVE